MINCPNCSHENTDGTQICEVCGHLLIEPTTSTRHYDDADYEEGVPKWGSARISTSMNLILDVLETQQSFVFKLDEITELVIGRKDPVTGEIPQIDLSIVNALDKGVSRNHAKIVRQQGALHVVDNQSANGTYLNGQKLVPKQPRIIRDGDDIRLGHLSLRVSFKKEQ